MLKWLRSSRSRGNPRAPSQEALPKMDGDSETKEKLDVQLHIKHDTTGNVTLTVVPPNTGAPPHIDVVIVIDTSGSMGDAANSDGPEEIKLFSKMDLAKRGAEVIARSLTAQDTLTILGFQSTVTQWQPRTHMDQQGLDAALAQLQLLRPGGGTALWDGLCAGLQQLEVQPADSAQHRLAVVILLTDGQPCPSPPEGEIAALTKYLAAHEAAAKCGQPLLTSKLVTLGFGYDVNSKLLVDLAHTHGFGNDFAFLPDGSMLLTNFVNLMANLKSSCMRRAVLRITPSQDKRLTDVAQVMDSAFTTDGVATHAPVAIPSIVSVLGEAAWKAVPAEGGTGLEILLGDLLYGCPRHVVLQEQRAGLAPDWSSWTVELQYEAVTGASSTARQDWQCEAAALDVPFVTQQLHRALAVSAIHHASRLAAVDLPGAQQAIKECALATMAQQGGPLLQGLEPHPIVEDLLGQVSEAISTKEAWTRWGSHYLRSLLFAHRAEACNNFKDPGVLAYGSSYTRTCREQLNTMCDSLPVPTPSIRDGRTAIGQPVNVSHASWTRTFNNQHGGCFGPGGMVRMADGSHRPVETLRKGDLVASLNGTAAAVVCVVTYSGAQVLRLPQSGLSITPWHPVRLAGSASWQFPVTLVANAINDAAPASSALPLELLNAASGRHVPSAVYNLVLDVGHVLVIDGVEAVTLGHGFQDPVVRHPFYGTDAVVRSLQLLPGWQQGLVDLGRMGCELDPLSGLVSGLSAATPVAQHPITLGC